MLPFWNKLDFCVFQDTKLKNGGPENITRASIEIGVTRKWGRIDDNIRSLDTPKCRCAAVQAMTS